MFSLLLNMNNGILLLAQAPLFEASTHFVSLSQATLSLVIIFTLPFNVLQFYHVIVQVKIG